MKYLIFVLMLFTQFVFAEVTVKKVSWIKSEPRGQNLYKVLPGETLNLISDQKVQGYLNVNGPRGAGWVYFNRVTVTQSFPLVECGQHNPYGFIKASIEVEVICRDDYTIGFDKSAKIPLWVAYTVTKEKAHTSNVDRAGGFSTDGAIEEIYQASDSDYLHTGFDKGHMTPSATFDASRNMNDSTYVFTNIAPQLPGFNRDMMGHKGVWGKLEHVIRQYAYKDDLFVISGSFYTASSRTIGDSVVVPDAFYKIILDSEHRLVGAFWMPHLEGGSESWGSFSVSIDEIESNAGIDVFPDLPAGRGLEGITARF